MVQGWHPVITYAVEDIDVCVLAELVSARVTVARVVG